MNVIIFKNYARQNVQGDSMQIKDLLNELEEKNTKKHIYTINEIDEIANSILKLFNCFDKKTSIPIVRIAQAFNFKTYRETLPNSLSGDIYINGETNHEYGHDKIILVNKKESFFHQRFVIAHELAHYLFDFLGKDEYSNPKIRFSDTYYKNQHETLEEKRANRFAASILMPKNTFIEQYHIARNEDNNRLYTILYLSQFFETPPESIEKRIQEVVK